MTAIATVASACRAVGSHANGAAKRLGRHWHRRHRTFVPRWQRVYTAPQAWTVILTVTTLYVLRNVGLVIGFTLLIFYLDQGCSIDSWLVSHDIQPIVRHPNLFAPPSSTGN